MRRATWYFDFISPFAYLEFRHLDRLPGDVELELVPVLFAGLLGHWKQLGPAEIPAKRVQTYRYCQWLARRLGVPFRTPPAHPFNPLKVLRLAIARDAQRDIVAGIFDYIWGRGGDVHGEAGFAELARELGIDAPDALIADDGVKARLRANTERAIAAGVYGVPTIEVGGELFWGYDTLDMCLDFLRDADTLHNPEMQRLATLPAAAERPR